MFDTLERGNLAQLHTRYDRASGLHAIIAIHNTQLGPALGGCRCLHYPNTEDAIIDASRLAESMSYKAALANLPLGGGKSVILLPTPNNQQPPMNRHRLYRAFGEFVESLNGQYITAVDSGTELQDLDHVALTTRHVVGTSTDGFDPSPVTALGVMRGLQAAIQHLFGHDNLQGLRVAIQGVGHVGAVLARLLGNAGAQLYISDINPERASILATETDAVVVPPDKIITTPCDVFAPCGLGAVLHSESIPLLNCKIIAGSANNQLAHDSDAQRLADRHILYCPDYVINAGGLIRVALAYLHRQQDVPRYIEQIATTLTQIFQQAEQDGATTIAVANRLAFERIQQGAHAGEMYAHHR